MEIGKLNRRIKIQSEGTGELDAFRQPGPAAWSTIYECWASIDIQGSQLVYSTAEFMSKVAHRITIRYTSTVIFSAKQRIVYTEPTTGVVHTYEIEAVLNTNQSNRELIFMCFELEAAE